jgi:hypothetical protein
MNAVCAALLVGAAGVCQDSGPAGDDGISLSCSLLDCNQDDYLDFIDLACLLAGWGEAGLTATHMAWMLANWGWCAD